MVGHPVPLQTPMQPEAFAPHFIATHHRGAFRQTQTAFGLGDFVEHTLLLPCGHGALARLLPMPGGAAELPRFFTEFKSYKQSVRCCALLPVASRWGGHRLSPP
jgi:hypothetical protein